MNHNECIQEARIDTLEKDNVRLETNIKQIFISLSELKEAIKENTDSQNKMCQLLASQQKELDIHNKEESMDNAIDDVNENEEFPYWLLFLLTMIGSIGAFLIQELINLI